MLIFQGVSQNFRVCWYQLLSLMLLGVQFSHAPATNKRHGLIENPQKKHLQFSKTIPTKQTTYIVFILVQLCTHKFFTASKARKKKTQNKQSFSNMSFSVPHLIDDHPPSLLFLSQAFARAQLRHGSSGLELVCFMVASCPSRIHPDPSIQCLF